jgi:DtxR family Mn-dependent transcriptional regulator
VSETSAMVEHYLKAIWNAREWTDQPVTVGALATRLGLAPSSVSQAVKKLTEQGLLTHARYGAIEFTPQGQRIAVSMVRKHRLIETFLVDYLGYGWDEVHAEAEELEHAVSAKFVDRLAARLGEPERDPHGDPIPHGDGTIPKSDAVLLRDVPPGHTVTVGRVSDNDPDLLRYLRRVGIGLDTSIRIMEHHRAAGTMEVEIAGARLHLGAPVIERIRVSAEGQRSL